MLTGTDDSTRAAWGSKPEPAKRTRTEAPSLQLRAIEKVGDTNSEETS